MSLKGLSQLEAGARGGRRRSSGRPDRAREADREPAAGRRAGRTGRATAAPAPARAPASAAAAEQGPGLRNGQRQGQASTRGVPRGPVAYRRRLHRLGPLAGLVAPAVLLALAFLVRDWWTADGLAGLRPMLSVWVLVLLALPTAAAVGLPWTAGDGMVIAAITSGLAWALLGGVAARRATRSSPVAAWREWIKEFAVLAAGVWAGALAGLGIVAWLLTHGS